MYGASMSSMHAEPGSRPGQAGKGLVVEETPVPRIRGVAPAVPDHHEPDPMRLINRAASFPDCRTQVYIRRHGNTRKSADPIKNIPR